MLIDEIIDILSDESKSLSEALLKTQVLLHKVGKKELAEWVRQELNGYPQEADLPEYRMLHANVLANFRNMDYRYASQPIPIMHLSEEAQKNLQTMTFRQALSVIEDMATKDKGDVIRVLPPEYSSMLDEGLSNGYHIERAWCQTPVHDVKGILTRIRSRLLDFILELKDTVGETEDEEKMKQKIEAIDTNSMFNHAIFGPNTTILVGANSQQTVQNLQIKSDSDALVKYLSELGIPQDEIKKLEDALSADKNDLGNPSLEGETGKWYTKLLARAVDKSLELGVDSVVVQVGNALKSYLGL